jgi:hypothetical protein
MNATTRRAPRRSFGMLLVLLLICLATSACGDSRFKKTYAVKGQVFFEGQPAVGAAVTLRVVGAADDVWAKPSGEVDEQGEFKVNTYRSGDGAPVGKYEVTVVWLPKGYNGPLEGGNKLPARYADPATSGLAIEVKATGNVLPTFNLTN